MFDLNTFVIDEPTRAIFSSANKTKWFTNQMENLSIKVDGEEVQKKDAHGNLIFTIVRGKTCEVGFDVAVYDINIIADMNGTEKKVASSTNKMIATAFEEFDIADGQSDIIIKNTAVDDTIYVQTLSTDGALKKVYTVGSAAGDGVVTYTKATKTISFSADDIAEGDTVLVVYDYETENAVGFDVSANDTNTSGKLYIEVKGYDICDSDTAIYAYYRFPAAKMKTSNQTDIKVDSTYHVDMDCAVDYCDKKKAFYSFVVPGVTE